MRYVTTCTETIYLILKPSMWNVHFWLGALIGSALGSIFSWFLVLILIGMMLSKGGWGLHGEE